MKWSSKNNGKFLKKFQKRYCKIKRYVVLYISHRENTTYGSLAQLGEHLPYKQRVIGSSPITPTTMIKIRRKPYFLFLFSCRILIDFVELIVIYKGCMKDFVKKHLMTIVCLIFVVVGGIVAGVVIPNLKEKQLQVSVKSLTVEVGERAKVRYSVNRDAVLTFSIDDETVATIEETTDEVYVLGVKEGVTRIKVVAQLGDLFCSASARVVVTAGGISSEPSTPENPDNPTPPPSDEVDDEENLNPVPEPEEELTMQVSFPDTINCLVENGTLVCMLSKTATISVNVSVDAISISVESGSPLINVVKNDLAGKSTYKLSATEAGEYVLTITATGAEGKLYSCDYNVIFQ